jgi:hypothetical protein
VRNLRSSIAWRFVGSAIATMSELPARETGITLWRSHCSRCTSFKMSASISYSSSWIVGTRYCCDRKFVMSWSLTNPSLARAAFRFCPVRDCSSWACRS